MTEPRPWAKLDNAAKIFPPTSDKRDTKVFRCACELKEPVEPAILQKALDKALTQFPFYMSVLKKGLFWYYLEQTNLETKIKEEYRQPCASLYDDDKKGLLFEVTYYKNRINVEVYHALSDGMGALNFLRTLVFYYLRYKYGDSQLKGVTLDYGASFTERRTDSFDKYYNGEKVKFTTDVRKAYHLKGERYPSYRLGVIEGRLKVSELLKLAKDKELSLGQFVTAVLIYSIHENMSLSDEKKPVTISIPVNLRSYFPTESSRNFFSTVKVSHDFRTQGKGLEDIFKSVKEAFEKLLTKENIDRRMNAIAAWEHSLPAKFIPLMAKIYILKIIGYFASKEVTAQLSNIGRVQMPEPMPEFIKLFDVFMSTKRLNICMTTFEDVVTISFTSPFINSDVQKNFFRALKSFGVSGIEIASNVTEEN